MGFPTIRPRRLRATPELRALVRETSLSPGDFVYPMFFHAGIDAPDDHHVAARALLVASCRMAVEVECQQAGARGLDGLLGAESAA